MFRGVAQFGLARVVWDHEVGGSNPLTPTSCYDNHDVMKTAERQKAVELRKRGLSYSEIEQRLNVSRGSLSLWLRDIPYTPNEKTRNKQRLASIRNGQILHRRKIQRISQIITAAKEEIQNVRPNELKLLGIMAYWTEGSKTKDSLVKFTNSDPKFIKFALKWLREICGVPEDKLRVHLRIHDDLNREEIERYWSEITGISLNRFYKTTYKISASGGKRYNKLKYGIAAIVVCDTNLFYKIMGWIEGISEKMKL